MNIGANYLKHLPLTMNYMKYKYIYTLGFSDYTNVFSGSYLTYKIFT